jgi:hypothetical protein
MSLNKKIYENSTLDVITEEDIKPTILLISFILIIIMCFFVVILDSVKDKIIREIETFRDNWYKEQNINEININKLKKKLKKIEKKIDMLIPDDKKTTDIDYITYFTALFNQQYDENKTKLFLEHMNTVYGKYMPFVYNDCVYFPIKYEKKKYHLVKCNSRNDTVDYVLANPIDVMQFDENNIGELKDMLKYMKNSSFKTSVAKNKILEESFIEQFGETD